MVRGAVCFQCVAAIRVDTVSFPAQTQRAFIGQRLSSVTARGVRIVSPVQTG